MADMTQNYGFIQDTVVARIWIYLIRHTAKYHSFIIFCVWYDISSWVCVQANPWRIVYFDLNSIRRKLIIMLMCYSSSLSQLQVTYLHSLGTRNHEKAVGLRWAIQPYSQKKGASWGDDYCIMNLQNRVTSLMGIVRSRDHARLVLTVSTWRRLTYSDMIEKAWAGSGMPCARRGFPTRCRRPWLAYWQLLS